MNVDRYATIGDYSALKSQKYYECNEERRWLDAVEPICSHKPHTVVEIGCGRGTFIDHIGQRVPYALGIDPVQHDCWTTTNMQGFKVGTLTDWPDQLINGDVTCSFDVLEHIPADQLYRGLDELARHTKIASYHAIYNGDDIRVINGERVQMHLTQRPPEWWCELFQIRMGGKARWSPCLHLPRYRFLVEVIL